MKLSVLLAKHDEAISNGCLKLSLGDGYLLQHNKVFRRIRQKALSLGFVYSDDINPDYIAFPMGQLEKILNTKTIPYVNNVTTLKNLNQHSKTPLEWDHIVDNLKPNYVFHESSHAVARSFSFKATDLPRQLMVMLIEESFANTCEFFAIADAQEMTHKLFLEVNSYFTVFEDRTNLKKALEKHGSTSVFKFMLLCYLHSNFLNDRLHENDFKKIFELSRFELPSEAHVFKNLAQNAFALNARFRYTTTEMYLRLNGLEASVKQALSFDYLKLIKTDTNLNDLISNLSLFIGDSDV